MKRSVLLTSIFCFIAAPILFSQIIWTEPIFPTDSEPLTVYFDATEGTGGLAGCNCDVYLHAGLITSNSSSSSDWKYVFTSWGQANDAWKMMPVTGQPDVYSWGIAPSIRERYNVTNSNEEILQLAFVFRNADGSKEGKDVGGTDIFYDVSQNTTALSASILSPAQGSFSATISETIPVIAAANQSATLSLYDNGNLLTTETGTSLEYDLEVTEDGIHVVKFEADNGNEIIRDSFYYGVASPNNIAPLPGGVEPGLTYHDDGRVTFTLVAPNKENVFLIGDFNNWLMNEDYQMNRTPDGTIWWITLDNLTPGETYAYQYFVNLEMGVMDPFSELILDPWNDPWIEPSVFPNLPAYPTPEVFDIWGPVSLCQPGAPEYQWQVNDFVRPDQGNLVIYELLMRDFLTQDYNSLSNMLDYLEELGINAIELMPVNEFSGNSNWGYHPTSHYALDKAYGTPDALRTLVDACHARGIAVILDVVYNHIDYPSPLCMLYWDDQNFRPAADNPWLNPTATHSNNVFFDFNHESFFTIQYVKKNLRHWLEDYRIDGFRFDLSAGFTQNTNGPFDATAYDAQRIETIKGYADEVWNTTPGAYMIMEHWTDWNEQEVLSEYGPGCMFWTGGGLHNEYLEAAMGYGSNLTQISYKSRGWDNPHIVGYMESHDEERMIYKNLQYGNSNGGYNVKDFSTALDRAELANTFFLTVPGPKMIWQFGELGYDYSLFTCPDGTVDVGNDGCKLSPKPIPYNYPYDQDRIDLYNTIRSLTHLRHNYEAFQTTNYDTDLDQYWKTIHLNHSSMNVAILGNFDVVNQTFNPKFQHAGTWYEYFTGAMLDVNDVNANLTLAPGEYRLYTDMPVTPPDFFTNDDEVITKAMDWLIAPNPTADFSTITVQLPASEQVQWQVFDLQGRLMAEQAAGKLSTGEHHLELPVLKEGMYLLRLQVGDRMEVRKLAVVK